MIPTFQCHRKAFATNFGKGEKKNHTRLSNKHRRHTTATDRNARNPAEKNRLPHCAFVAH